DFAGSAACLTCSIGYTSAVGSAAVSDCVFVACPTGYTGDEGSGCTACSPGSYKDSAGSAACVTCPDGYNSSAGSLAASNCTFNACPAGFTGDEGSGCFSTVISLGTYHTCGQTSTPSLKCWGTNGNGQIGDGTTIQRNTPVVVALGGTAVAVALGEANSCALLVKEDGGSIKCWGSNGYGQLGDGTTTDRYTPDVVNLGGTAVADDGSLKCWGYNGNGRLGDGTTTQRNTPVPEAIGCRAGVGECTAQDDGSLKCWGYNGQGALGDGTNTESHTPVDP
ncbi:regulator of chromosome condensation 1/beta-lactamase-inhibitor protein II, partial [Baffinella frigidus]